jgi:hypothetical protein
VGVVVVERPGEELDVERPGLGALRTVRVLQTHPAKKRLGLGDADLVVVEADVEVHVLAAADQPVVGDHRDLLVGRRLQLAAECRAVDRGDDQHVGALGDHLVDLLGLGRDVVVRVLQIDLVALRLELLLHRLAVGDPALGGLRRHRHTDHQVLGVFSGGVAAAARTFTATCRGAEHQDDAAQSGQKASVHDPSPSPG